MFASLLFNREINVSRKFHVQWNLDLTKSLGTGQIRSLNRVISRFFFTYFTITGAKNTVRYIEVFVKSRFYCNKVITMKRCREWKRKNFISGAFLINYKIISDMRVAQSREPSLLFPILRAVSFFFVVRLESMRVVIFLAPLSTDCKKK